MQRFTKRLHLKRELKEPLDEIERLFLYLPV
jgi:hypothetical protein